jgi:hypothetical protein
MDLSWKNIQPIITRIIPAERGREMGAPLAAAFQTCWKDSVSMFLLVVFWGSEIGRIADNQKVVNV